MPTPIDALVGRLHTGFHWRRVPGKPPSCIHRPLTAARLSKHLEGGPAVGLTPIAPGASTTQVAVLDLDSHRGEVPWPQMTATALQLMAAGEGHGLRLLPFRSSGGQGIHLYATWEAPQDARSVRALLRLVLDECALGEGTGGVGAGEVEVFPKQDRVPEDGFGSMFILPLAGASVALDPLELEPMEAELVTWPASAPVPVVEAEPPRPSSTAAEAPLEEIVRAVDLIPNTGEAELDYNTWFRLICAIHAGTGGSEEGLELAHQLSAKSVKYDEAFLDDRVWPYIKDREGGISVQSLFAAAREYGYQEDVSALFEDLGPLPEEALPAVAPRPAPGTLPALPFDVTEKTGQPVAKISNIMLALAEPAWTGIRIAYDQFKDEVLLSTDEGANWRAFTDDDYTRLRLYFESVGGFTPVPKELMRDCVLLVAQDNAVDTAILWLRDKVPAWDGVDRIETFYPHYLRTVDTPYARAIGKYMWTAMAGRVLVPGIKADMVPIWVGAQGTLKTTAVNSLVPDDQFFTEIRFDSKDDDLARQLRGKLVAEIGELRGLHTRELEAIKSFITRRVEEWVPKYREFRTSFKRRVVFIGTTNEDEFLGDASGNRRWLPIAVGVVDRAAIERDRLQLWAEARDRFLSAGVGWQGVVELAAEAHEMYRQRDSWEELVAAWLEERDPVSASGKPRKELGVTVHELLNDGLGIDVSRCTRSDEMRVAKICKFLGMTKQRSSRNGLQVTLWRKL